MRSGLRAEGSPHPVVFSHVALMLDISVIKFVKVKGGRAELAYVEGEHPQPSDIVILDI